MADLLIAGGSRDANLPWLRDAAGRLGIDCLCIFTDEAHSPAFRWDVGSGRATIDGAAIDCRAAFVRYDVFAAMVTGAQTTAATAAAWFAAISSYCSASGIFQLNSNIEPLSASKPWMLVQAQAAGLAIPSTIVTNEQAAALMVGPPEGAIAKPVAGGSYVVGMDDALAGTVWEAGGLAPHPAIVQPRLVYPERRIYRVGTRFFVLDIASQTLDSRLDPQMAITHVPNDELPAGMLAAIRTLTDRIRCDFCAIDTKTDPTTGELVFLELNNGPMFMAYDRATQGAMSEEMLRYLVSEGKGAGPT